MRGQVRPGGRVKLARLSRGSTTYATGKPQGAAGMLVLRLRAGRRLQPGRYIFTVVQQLDGRRLVTKSIVRVI